MVMELKRENTQYIAPRKQYCIKYCMPRFVSTILCLGCAELKRTLRAPCAYVCSCARGAQQNFLRPVAA